MTDLACIGLTTLDIIARPVSQLPPGGETALVEQIALAPAGTAGGMAVVAARLGLKASLISAIGKDRNGGILKGLFEEEGVDTAHLLERDDMPTSTTILLVRKDGERPNLHMLGASVMSAFTPEAVETAKAARFLHFGGVGFPNLTGPQVLEAVGGIRAAGTFVTGDLISPHPHLVEFLKSLLPHVDVFMPSLAEAKALLGLEDPVEAARAFADMGAGACVVKCGEAGCVAVKEGEVIRIPARKVSVVDTTSCGDSFCAGFVAGLAKGAEFQRALEYGTVTASFVAQGAGTLGALQGMKQVEEVLGA
ncbi:MAG: carbohydrate kinase family protein [Alphaproteobacteria bacterium]|nr:carbohydrate kinase family protein [Alphaproteobacteria bacterium]